MYYFARKVVKIQSPIKVLLVNALFVILAIFYTIMLITDLGSYIV